MRLSAPGYYLKSFYTLLTRTSFWLIPLVLVKKPVLYKIAGHNSFYVDRLMDIWVLKELLLDKQYDYFTGNEHNWSVVDIGSGIGEFSVTLSPKVKHIYAFDPDVNRYALALKNIKLAKAKNITLKKEAVKTIESVFKKYRIKKCDLLKIDCEGCEYPLLLNSSPLAIKKIRRIVLEAHLFTPEMKTNYQKLKRMLEKSGFKISEKENPVHTYLRFVYAFK